LVGRFRDTPLETSDRCLYAERTMTMPPRDDLKSNRLLPLFNR
jgi:hypothetical protein